MLQSEKKPNGLQLLYNYDSNNRITGIKSQNKNGQTLASFDCDIHHYNINIKTCNNRSIDYTFDKLKDPDKKKYFLTKVSRPSGPDEFFDYAAPDSKTPHRLVKKSRLGGRAIGIEYFEKGVNEIPFGRVDIKDREDLRIGRVKALKAPVGHDSALHYICKFKYNINTIDVDVSDKKHPGTEFITELVHGDTCVFDVYNHLTRYFYNQDQRLTTVEKYLGQGPNHTLYTRESLFWDGHKLTNRIFHTKEGWAQYARQYDYDKSGNVWRQTLWGNLSGNNEKPIIYPPSGYPEYNGCEFEFKLFTYSDDGLNLMTSQTEGKTTHTIYKYHGGTDLLAAKLTGPIGAISLREFYEYDQNGVLVLQIEDDGSSPDKDDFTDVSERRVKRILPSSTFPIGLPLIIEEKFVDLATGYEDFIKRTVQTFTQEGWLSRKEVYDQNNAFAYAERWEYNKFGDVTLYEDPAGRITEKTYDDNCNLTKEQGPSPDFHIEYEYDFSDRLVKKDLVFDKNHPIYSGLKLSEGYVYDMRSNLVATVDIYGNKTSYKYDEFGAALKRFLQRPLMRTRLYVPE